MNSLLGVFGRRRTPKQMPTEGQLAAAVGFAVFCGANSIALLLLGFGRKKIPGAEIAMRGLQRAITVAKEDFPKLRARGIPLSEEELIRLVTQRWMDRGDLML